MILFLLKNNNKFKFYNSNNIINKNFYKINKQYIIFN